jgi:hypothetical protein
VKQKGDETESFMRQPDGTMIKQWLAQSKLLQQYIPLATPLQANQQRGLHANAQMKVLHGLSASASDAELTSAVEKSITDNLQRDYEQMRIMVNKRLPSGTSHLEASASREEIYEAVKKLDGDWQTLDPSDRRFDPGNDTPLYRFPGTATPMKLSDINPNANPYELNPNYYYCHQFTFGEAFKTFDHYFANFNPLPPNTAKQVGDVIAYGASSWDGQPGDGITHTGRVVHVGANGEVIVASKLGPGELAIHHPQDPTLLATTGPKIRWFREASRMGPKH